MDGNDSLKRVERKEDVLQEKEEGGEDLPQASKERIDCRTAGEDYFATRAETTAWAESHWESIAEVLTADPPLNQPWAESQCEDRWHNMDEKKTSRSVGKFYEYGWFVLLCWHMMFLLACNMIRSGEL